MKRVSVSKLYDFHGGIHPPEFKTLSNQTAIERTPLPRRLYVPLTQSVGTAATACVSVGERVLKGQTIGTASGRISSAVHAPSSGQISAIVPHPLAHPSGLDDLTVIIDCDGQDEWITRQPLENWQDIDPEQVRQFLCDMGIVGLGGGIFPSHLKLGVSGLDTLVINGAECEPFITCDDRLMRERADQVIAGIAILAHLTQPRRVAIGVEDNKPEAIAALREAGSNTTFEVITVPTKYPSGGAKQLIRILTGKEIPHGVRSTDFGVQCFNVATAYSINRAIHHGEPLISRIVTLTGAVERPQNVEALIGTPVEELIHCAGRHQAQEIVMGGPLMGFVLPTWKTGIHKATNCLIAKNDQLLPPRPPALPCIRCGECARVCPACLQPMDLYWFAKARQFGKAQEWHLFDCIECGACSYVCPSQIPLVEFYHYAKSEIWAAEREKKAADLARRRHDYRQMRQEREQAEKAQTAKPADTPVPAMDDGKAAQIRAAMERAAAKKAASHPVEGTANPDSFSDDSKRAAIEAAMQRAAAKKTAQTNTSAESTPVIDDEKRAAIQAAMERAAAKKAVKSVGATDSAPVIDETKRAAIQAAMERAAAKKAAKETGTETPVSATGIDDEKRAAIQAAMERAAAKKAARAAETTDTNTSAVQTATPDIDDEKRAAIKAAMERAAARKRKDT